MRDENEYQHHHTQFDNTIHQLIGMRWATAHRCNSTNHRTDCDCGGTTRISQPSLYTQIRDDVRGLTGNEGRGKAESRPPLWIDGIDWLNTTDTIAATWTPHLPTRTGTVARLDELSRHHFGPNDTQWLKKATRQLATHITKGETLIQGEEQRRLDVVAPCPSCGTQTVRRQDSGGDWVRQTALQLTIRGCTCQACGQRWDRDHLNFLAEVIGCERQELA